MVKLLFVCLGNICRSPSAEAVMNALIQKQNLSNRYSCDSAGTYGGHAGQRADSRMQKHAVKRGYNLTSISRKFIKSDFENFDYIVAMDDSNYHNILSMDSSKNYHNKVFRMIDFCSDCTEGEVPDPYYGGAAGFENVLDILEKSTVEFLDYLEKKS